MWKLLDDLKQKCMKEELGTPLTLKEFQPVIKKLSLHKAPGLNEISSNTLRALDFDNTKSFFIICCNFFNNEIHIPENIFLDRRKTNTDRKA